MLMCLEKRLLFRVLENYENTLFNFLFYCLLVNVFTVTELSLVIVDEIIKYANVHHTALLSFTNMFRQLPLPSSV